MTKQELAERLAKQSRRSHAEAADAVDNLVYEILKDLQQPAKQSQTLKQTTLPKSLSANPIRKK